MFGVRLLFGYFLLVGLATHFADADTRDRDSETKRISDTFQEIDRLPDLHGEWDCDLHGALPYTVTNISFDLSVSREGVPTYINLNNSDVFRGGEDIRFWKDELETRGKMLISKEEKDVLVRGQRNMKKPHKYGYLIIEVRDKKIVPGCDRSSVDNRTVDSYIECTRKGLK